MCMWCMYVLTKDIQSKTSQAWLNEQNCLWVPWIWTWISQHFRVCQVCDSAYSVFLTFQHFQYMGVLSMASALYVKKHIHLQLTLYTYTYTYTHPGEDTYIYNLHNPKFFSLHVQRILCMCRMYDTYNCTSTGPWSDQLGLPLIFF